MLGNSPQVADEGLGGWGLVVLLRMGSLGGCGVLVDEAFGMPKRARSLSSYRKTGGVGAGWFGAVEWLMTGGLVVVQMRWTLVGVGSCIAWGVHG